MDLGGSHFAIRRYAEPFDISYRHHRGLRHTSSGGNHKGFLASLSRLNDLAPFVGTGDTGVCAFAGIMVNSRLNDGLTTIWPRHDYARMDLMDFTCLKVLHVPSGCFFEGSPKS